MNFPEDWPASCPPERSIPAQGDAYRIVKNDPVLDEDFLSQHDLNQAHSADECLRRSLSIFLTEQDAAHMQRKRPKLGRFIAKGVLDHSHGKVLRTGGSNSSHAEWWSYDGLDRKSGFAVMKGI